MSEIKIDFNQNLTLKEFKDICQKINITFYGSKKQLIERIKKKIEESVDEEKVIASLYVKVI
jgi:predicted SpoU family rRNA methylase